MFKCAPSVVVIWKFQKCIWDFTHCSFQEWGNFVQRKNGFVRNAIYFFGTVPTLVSCFRNWWCLILFAILCCLSSSLASPSQHMTFALIESMVFYFLCLCVFCFFFVGFQCLFVCFQWKLMIRALPLSVQYNVFIILFAC